MLNQSVILYILDNYPEEEGFLVDADRQVTFADLWETLDAHADVYGLLGICDSMDREYAFEGLVDALNASGYNVSYDDVYLTWLDRRESVI